VNDIAENKLSDYILVEKVLGGDTHAFSVIISNTERLVAQIIFKMIDDDEDKRDIAQDVYLKAFQKLGSFKFQAKLSTWIGHIAYNACCNYLEKKKLVLVNNTYNNDRTDEELLESLSSNKNLNNETESLIFKSELSQILKIEIDKLSPLYKTLITLFHTEELSYAEIGQITELPDGTIKNYLFRARKTLKENLLKNYKREDLSL
jgi:RNA polymerase sigma factor (sigma-70 family)